MESIPSCNAINALIAQFRKESTPVLFLHWTPSAIILMKVDADINNKKDVKDLIKYYYYIPYLTLVFCVLFLCMLTV